MYRNNRMMACYHCCDHVINVYPGPNVQRPHYLVTDEQHDTLHRLLAWPRSNKHKISIALLQLGSDWCGHIEMGRPLGYCRKGVRTTIYLISHY